MPVFLQEAKTPKLQDQFDILPYSDSVSGNGSDFAAKFPLLSDFQPDLAVCQEPGSLSPAVRVWLPEKMGAVDGAEPRGSGPGVSGVSMGPCLLQFQFRPLVFDAACAFCLLLEPKHCPSDHQILRGVFLSVCNPSFRFGPSFRDPATQPGASSEIPFHTIPDCATPRVGMQLPKSETLEKEYLKIQS